MTSCDSPVLLSQQMPFLSAFVGLRHSKRARPPSCAGFVAQARTTGQSPLDNLSAHLADPWANNVLASASLFPSHLIPAEQFLKSVQRIAEASSLLCQHLI